MGNDFVVAKAALQKAGMPSLKAVWLDCIEGCCREGRHGWDETKTIFVGGGHGAPNIIMEESGLTNAFADRPRSWYCVSLQDIIDADPDVFVIVAALDMVSAAMHLHTGDAVLNFQSGVDFFEDDFVKDHAANLKCPYAGKKEKVADRVAELEAELEQCAEDNSLNAAAVLDRLRQGTIKVVFD